MDILVVIIIAISLSMDAFSLSLAYGTLGLERKTRYQLSLIVGMYHFIMPLLGILMGSIVLKIIPIEPDTLVFIVLLFIGIEMIYETFTKQKHMNINSFVQLTIFGLAVSIDSFSVGMGLQSLNTNYILCSLIFAIASSIFTYLGLYLGKKINNLFGQLSTFIGGIILILIGLYYIL